MFTLKISAFCKKDIICDANWWLLPISCAFLVL